MAPGLAVLCAMTLLHGCFSAEAPTVRIEHHQANRLDFVVYPIIAPAEMAAALAPLCRHIEERVHREVNVVVPRDYGRLRTIVRRGTVELGWFDPRLEPSVGFSPLCAVNAAGKGSYRGVVVVRRDSGVNNLQELAGLHFAYVDRNSVSGFIRPNALFEREGIDPLQHFGEISFAGSHDRCLEGVLAGTYDGCAMSDILQKIDGGKGELLKKVRVLANTDPIYPAPIVVSTTLTGADAAAIGDAFISFSTDPAMSAERNTLSRLLNIGSFAPADEVRQ